MNANQIKVSADEFARYKKLGAEKAAIEREQKNIVAGWEAAGLLPAKVKENLNVPFVIVNGNGDEVGKVSVYEIAEKVIPATIARRIS